MQIILLQNGPGEIAGCLTIAKLQPLWFLTVNEIQSFLFWNEWQILLLFWTKRREGKEKERMKIEKGGREDQITPIHPVPFRLPWHSSSTMP